MGSFPYTLRRNLGCVVVCFTVAVVTAIVGGAYQKWSYPYGWSHCCIIQVRNALEEYAENNNAKYPAGESCPEASLSLTYGVNGLDANAIRGMTVPEATVLSILMSGQKLGPNSCGWNYVPGLTLADNPNLALLWCKMPLDHNGRRSGDGGRQVIFVGGNIEWVSGAKWTRFLAEQNELMNRRSAREVEGLPLVTGVIELPDGSRIDHIEGSYAFRESVRGPDGSQVRGGGESGAGLNHFKLDFYRAPLENGTVTRSLSFDDMVSDAVTVTFDEGVPDLANLVFKMKTKE